VARRIRSEDIEEVRSSARIEVIVGERVSLKPAGVGSLKGLCPFHDERTASFHVRPAVGLWHCFGCSEGGDTINFVMRSDMLGFVEAVEYLALRFGVQLRYETTGPDAGAGPASESTAPSRSRLFEANRLAAKYYASQLDSPAAVLGRNFLRGRGFGKDDAETFGLGYSPEGWDSLLRHLTNNSFTHAELLAAGLVTQGQRGVYDRFRGRLMWPIRDVTNQVVGFGARRLAEDDQGPKYLNTPETPLYKKSQILYGVNLAKQDISAKRQVVVVEGYTDVMAAYLAGVREAVATCGTAFGQDHIRVVRRLLGDFGDPSSGVITADGGARGGRVVFTFDGDAAGQKAALRAFQGDQSFYAQTFVAIVPGGMDPCDLWYDQGDDALKDLVATAQPMFKFAIRVALDALDLDTAEGRAAGLRAGAPIVAGIRDDVIRMDYTRQLAGWVGADYSLVMREVKAARGRPQRLSEAGETASGPGRGVIPADPVIRAEHFAIAAALQHPNLVPPSFDQLSGSDLKTPTLAAILDAIQAARGVAVARSEAEAAAKAAVETKIKAAAEAGAKTPSEAELKAEAQAAVDAVAKAWLARVSDQAAQAVRPAITQLAVEPLPTTEAGLEAYVIGATDSLVEMGLTHQIADLDRRLRQADGSTGQAGQAGSEAMLRQLAELRRQRDSLRLEQGDY